MLSSEDSLKTENKCFAKIYNYIVLLANLKSDMLIDHCLKYICYKICERGHFLCPE